MTLALVTGVSVREWEEAGPAAIATAVELLAEGLDEQEEGGQG